MHMSRSRMEDERHDDVAGPSKGNTVTAQGENQAPKARQPNERDESADSQAPDSDSIRYMGAVAHEAEAKGQQDTSKAQELDATYHQLQQTSEPAPQDKVNRGGRKT
jgi:hypothetical protein